jgi:hypothetical protein
MGRTVLRGFSVLLLLLGLALGGVATFIYLLVGTRNEIAAKGFTISADELSGCTSFVLDVESAYVSPVSGDLLLGDRETYLEISASPESILQSLKVDTSALNEVLLGKRICVIQNTDGPTVKVLNSGDTALSVTDFPNMEISVGEKISFPDDDLPGNSLLISFDPSRTFTSDIAINGLIKYPQSSVILWASSCLAVVFLIAALILTVAVRNNRKRKDHIEKDHTEMESTGNEA